MLKRFTRFVSAFMAVSLAALSFCTSLPAKADTTEGSYPDFSYITNDAFNSATLQKIAKQIYTALESNATEIRITDAPEGKNYWNYPEICSVVSSVYMDIAQNYDVGINYKGNSAPCSYSSDGSMTIKPILLSSYKIDLEKQLDSILSGVDKGWSDYEVALYLHEWLAMNRDYQFTDNADERRHTAYEMLNNDSAVCQGYAALYSMLINRFAMQNGRSIQSLMVSSDSINHAWNVVKIDNKWYNVDVTHDDKVHGNHPGLVYHDQFLIDNDTKLSLNQANFSTYNPQLDFTLTCGVSINSGFVSSTGVTNNFWSDTMSSIQPIVIDGDPGNVQWMRVRKRTGSTLDIDLCDMENASATPTTMPMYSATAAWNVISQPGYSYTGSYSSLITKDNVLFFNNDTQVVAFYNGKSMAIANMTDDEKAAGRIYGLKVNIDGTLSYCYSEEPNSNPTTPKVISTTTIDEYVAKVKEELGTGTVTFKSGDNVISRVNDLCYSNLQEFNKVIPYVVTQSTTDYDQGDKNYYSDSSCTQLFTNTFITSDADVFLRGAYLFRFMGGNAEVTDGVMLNLYIALDDATHNDESGYVDITVEDGDNPLYSKTVMLKDTVYNTEFKGYLLDSIRFSAKDMDKRINISGSSNNINMVGGYSVNEYLNGLKAPAQTIVDGMDDKTIDWNEDIYNQQLSLLNFTSSMLVYGDYAKAYFLKSTVSDESQKKLDAVFKDDGEICGPGFFPDPVTEPNISFDAAYLGTLPDGIRYIGSTLLLKDKTAVRHYFTVNSNVNIEDYTFKIDGNIVSPAAKTDLDRTYYVEQSNIDAPDLSKAFEATVTKGESTYSIRYSPCCYMKEIYENTNITEVTNPGLKDLMRSLFYYYRSALVYKRAS